ncbi:MAG: type II toxin-antitoxin system RelE/ParE family toxin [Desulfovibrionaceae bacterium]
MAEIRLTPAARSHLLDIWDYTASTWGEDQADAYIREIHAAFLRLAKTPGLGIARPEIHQGYRSLPVKQHLVFYTVTGNATFVYIIGVL